MRDEHPDIKAIEQKVTGFKLAPQISWLRERSFDYSVENARPLKDLRPSSLPENFAESIKNNPSLMPEVDIVCSHEDEEWRFYPIAPPPTPEWQLNGMGSPVPHHSRWPMPSVAPPPLPRARGQHGWVTKMLLLMVLQPYPSYLGPCWQNQQDPNQKRKMAGYRLGVEDDREDRCTMRLADSGQNREPDWTTQTEGQSMSSRGYVMGLLVGVMKPSHARR